MSRIDSLLQQNMAEDGLKVCNQLFKQFLQYNETQHFENLLILNGHGEANLHHTASHKGTKNGECAISVQQALGAEHGKAVVN
jgi:hypothetical protein